MEMVEANIYGMSCDGVDQVADNILVPKDLDIDDWICFGGMGAYTFTLRTDFNSMTGSQNFLNLKYDNLDFEREKEIILGN